MNNKQKKVLYRIIACSVMMIGLHFAPIDGILQLALYLTAYIIIGHDILLKSWKGIRNGQVFDENFLMAVATIGAFILAIYDQTGDYEEGIAVMLF